MLSGLKFLEENIIFILLFERQSVRMSAPLLRHGAVGAGILIMRYTNAIKIVVAILAIVWYILEIITKVVQLLR